METIESVLSLMRQSKYREAEELLTSISGQSLHCATCQCERIRGKKPAPGNERSKSWHGTAPTTKPG